MLINVMMDIQAQISSDNFINSLEIKIKCK